jgi:tetratricopeptide (TPR) repeat protein
VIHRDLKPSNVLVSLGDPPAPKIIDFGIAKATGQKLTERTVVTTHGQALGTLAYMSPEQAEMSGLDVDTRTDVYSLGVILFELLSGKVPLDPKERGAPAFLAELIERDRSMPTLSGRLATLEPNQQEMFAKMRGTDLRSLKKTLTEDLQWIVLKAIEKDRSRRYETANGLAMDLKRYLANQPVEARQPTAVYRFGKFVRRNRLPVAAAGALATAVLFGLAGTSVGLVRARAAEAEAEQQTATAEAALGFMIGVFSGADPVEGGSADMTAREVLDASISRIDTLESQPMVQGRLLQAMGAVYTDLGLFEQADTLLRRALAVRRGDLGESDGPLERSIRQLAWLYFNQGRMSDALPLAVEAASIAERAYEPGSALMADALQVLGMVQRELTLTEEARRNLERSLEIREAVFGPAHIQSGHSLRHLAWLELGLGNLEEARRIYERLVPIYESHYGPDHVTTAGIRMDYASAIRGDPATADSALSIYMSVLDLRERAFGPDHVTVGHLLNNIGNTYAEMGEQGAAQEYYLRALAVYERTEQVGTQYARLLRNLAKVSMTLGEQEAAEAWYRRALQGWERSVGRDHPDYSRTLRQLAGLLRSTDRPDEATRLEARADSLQGETEESRPEAPPGS